MNCFFKCTLISPVADKTLRVFEFFYFLFTFFGFSEHPKIRTQRSWSTRNSGNQKKPKLSKNSIESPKRTNPTKSNQLNPKKINLPNKPIQLKQITSTQPLQPTQTNASDPTRKIIYEKSSYTRKFINSEVHIPKISIFSEVHKIES